MTTTSAVNTAIAEVQAQISRADTKASILTGLALAALTGGTALTVQTHPHGAALAAAVLTAALNGVALVLLGLAIRPDLRGNHGFVRWAATTSDTDLYGDLTHDYPSDQHAEQLCDLALLSRSAYRKYTRIRRAVDLLGAALAAAAVTALLSGLGW